MGLAHIKHTQEAKYKDHETLKCPFCPFSQLRDRDPAAYPQGLLPVETGPENPSREASSSHPIQLLIRFLWMCWRGSVWLIFLLRGIRRASWHPYTYILLTYTETILNKLQIF